MNESFAKYMAGLLDADGCLSFAPVDGKLYLRLVLCASESIDRSGAFIKALPELTGVGTVQTTVLTGAGHSTRNDWRISARTDLNTFLPWVIKHMVIKGKHWQWMLEVYTKMKGQNISPEGLNKLKLASAASRQLAGPLKSKSHPSWAWVAGYFDGDGCYKNRFDKKSGKWHRRIVVECSKSDRIALELLFKAFGGSIYDHDTTSVWSLNLGPRNSSMAEKLLPEMAKHSRLKKHKIAQLIHFHRQRLSDSTPTGEAIVQAA